MLRFRLQLDFLEAARVNHAREQAAQALGRDPGLERREPAHIRAAASALRAKGWQLHRQTRKAELRHVEAARSRHDEASWGKRLHRVLQFLFPPPPRTPSRSLETGSRLGRMSRPAS